MKGVAAGVKLCAACNGCGQSPVFLGVSRFLLSWEDCPFCGGSGKAQDDDPGAAIVAGDGEGAAAIEKEEEIG